MKVRLLSIFFLYVLLGICSPLKMAAQTGDLPRSTPEAEGVPSQALINMFDSLMAVPDTDIHSVMVLRHGNVIAEMFPAPFAPEHRHTLYSVSKTFVGAAVGLAIDENRLRLSDRVATFFPEQLPDSISANLAEMTVADLLTMRSGVKPDWAMRNKRVDWLHGFLSKPVEKPGQEFAYDSMCTYLLSAIVQKVTGVSLLDYLKEKIFEPMHVTEVAWEVSPEGINTGGWGLHTQSEVLAKFGQLLLNKGVWEGRQLLPAEWVEQMMTQHVATKGDGYGYQMWRCDYPGAVRADGALGQYIIVMPEENMVVVITECSLTNGKAQRGFVWDLMPRVGERQLAPGKDYRRLQKKLQSYRLPWVEGKASSSFAAKYSGKTIQLNVNKYGWRTLRLIFKPREVVMEVMDDSGEPYELRFGYRQWLESTIAAYPPYSIQAQERFKGIDGPFVVAGSYAWPAGETLQLKAHYVNWVSALEMSFHLEGDKVSLRVKENYSRGNGITLEGRL